MGRIHECDLYCEQRLSRALGESAGTGPQRTVQ